MTSNDLIPSCGQQKPTTQLEMQPTQSSPQALELRMNLVWKVTTASKALDSKLCQRKNSDPKGIWILLNSFGTNSLLTLRLQLKPNEERQTRIRQDICSLSKKRETGPVHNLDVSIASTPVVLTSSWWACSRRPSSKGGLSQRHWILIGYQQLSDWILIEMLGTSWNSFASLCSFGQGWQRMASDPQILKALDPIWSHRCTLSQNTLNNLNTLRHISTYFEITDLTKHGQLQTGSTMTRGIRAHTMLPGPPISVRATQPGTMKHVLSMYLLHQWETSGHRDAESRLFSHMGHPQFRYVRVSNCECLTASATLFIPDCDERLCNPKPRLIEYHLFSLK